MTVTMTSSPSFVTLTSFGLEYIAVAARIKSMHNLGLNLW